MQCFRLTELDKENKLLGENGRCGQFCDMCRVRPCMREVDHAGSGPPIEHCLCSLASRGVNCATIKMVELVDAVEHYKGEGLQLVLKKWPG